MKSFMEYICESTLSKDDFSKHDFKYLAAVIHDIINVGKIGIGKEKIDHLIEIDPEVKIQFENYIGNESSLSYDEFNNIAKMNS
jgi:hypothetical protein